MKKAFRRLLPIKKLKKRLGRKISWKNKGKEKKSREKNDIEE